MLLLLATCSALHAASGAAFLKIGPSARATSMGGAVSALANDSSAIFYNPAGLSFLSQREVSFTHARWISQMSFNSLSAGFPIRYGQAVGMGFIYLSPGNIERRDINRQVSGSFSGSDMALSLNYARVIHPKWRWRMGIGAKLIRQSVDGASALGVLFDFGQRYSIGRFSLGLSLMNMGPRMRFLEESFQPPAQLAFGMGYHIQNVAKISADVRRRLFENKTELALGGEFWPVGLLALRAGYLAKIISAIAKSSLDGGLGDLQGLSGGIGFKISSYQLDYAFVPLGLLGNTHRLSLSARF